MGIHGYILMYSIISRRSFDMVSTIRDKLLNAVSFAAPSLACLGIALPVGTCWPYSSLLAAMPGRVDGVSGDRSQCRVAGRVSLLLTFFSFFFLFFRR